MLRYLLIADDHPICVAALTMAAQRVDGAIAVETATSLAEVEQRICNRRYDAVLLDLRLPDGDGFEGLAMLARRCPKTPVAIVSSSDSPQYVRRAAELGARGFVSKAASVDAMYDALVALLEGRAAFPEGFDVSAIGSGSKSDPLAQLTPAQLRVLRELRDGHANKEIGFRLGLAEPTVKRHLSAIFRALGVSNRNQAMLAMRQGPDGLPLR